MEKADIIIPVYKPDGKFLTLIEKLGKQSVLPNRIIIMNTEQKYYDRLIYGTSFQKEHRDMVVKHLSRREFDHGRTRNRGVQYSDTDFFIMMTQDAVPADEFLVEELLKGLHSGENTAVAYARQLAQDTSSEAEKFTRNFNYPEEAAVKTKADIDKLGIKAFFCSNVCAAYKREIFDSLGGFIKHTIFNEDMIYAAGALRAGYGIAYRPSAKVYHSHDYSNKEQFHRYFDLGVSQTDHPEVFADIPSESEGAKLVKMTIAHLRENGMQSQIPRVIINNAFKYLGYLFGRNYRKLPRKLIVGCSSNKDYWD